MIDTAFSGPMLKGMSTSLISRATHFRQCFVGFKKQVCISRCWNKHQEIPWYAQAHAKESSVPMCVVAGEILSRIATALVHKIAISYQ